MNKNSLILIGGGGHCKACIDVIEAEGVFTIKGILDVKEKVGETVLAYSIIGTDDDIPSLVAQGFSFLITLGQITNASIRKKLYERLKSSNGRLATVISPTSTLSKYAKIGEGTIIMHLANISADTSIGENCIINTGVDIEHDVSIGKHCHISTHAVINGDCALGDEIFVGSGSTLKNDVSIANNVVVGIGALVLKNVNESGTFVGNPIRKIKNG